MNKIIIGLTITCLCIFTSANATNNEIWHGRIVNNTRATITTVNVVQGLYFPKTIDPSSYRNEYKVDTSLAHGSNHIVYTDGNGNGCDIIITTSGDDYDLSLKNIGFGVCSSPLGSDIVSIDYMP